MKMIKKRNYFVLFLLTILSYLPLVLIYYLLNIPFRDTLFIESFKTFISTLPIEIFAFIAMRDPYLGKKRRTFAKIVFWWFVILKNLLIVTDIIFYYLRTT